MSNREWFPTSEARVRQVFGLMLCLKNCFGNYEYGIRETATAIDLIHINGYQDNDVWLYKYSKELGQICSNMSDRAPLNDLVQLYCQYSGTTYGDNLGLTFALIAHFSEIAKDMGIKVKPGDTRPNITKPVMLALFAPSQLPSFEWVAGLLPGFFQSDIRPVDNLDEGVIVEEIETDNTPEEGQQQ